MCGRFTLTSSAEQISAVLPGLVLDAPPTPRYNIAPSQDILAVLNDGSRMARPVRWGLIPFWSKDPAIGNRMINARAESLAEKPSFRTPLKRSRCLILADGFYEWKTNPGEKTKTPMYIRLKSGQPFVFAGLWDRWRSPDGEDVVSATIITTEPNALLADIHSRMPAILAAERYDLWLKPAEQTVDRLLPCLAPYPAEDMLAISVSTRVNKPSFDDPSCIQPAQAQ